MGANLIKGFGGTADFGQTALGRVDDGSGSINVGAVFENGITFFGQTYSSLFVNNNGSITFGGPRSSLTPGFIDNTGLREIAVLFSDVDTRSTISNLSPGGNSTGSNRVYYALDTVNDRIVITWDDVGYFDRKMDKVNAFQLILSDKGQGNFDIEFRYESVDWTTVNTTIAQAGISTGTGQPGSFYTLPMSGNASGMLAIDETPGNTGEAGRWLFNIRPAALFGNDQDIVDFNHLLPSQAQAILAGAQVTAAGSGNDGVWLPNVDVHRVDGTIFWDPDKKFDAGAGNDTVHGGDRKDVIFGNSGDDLLFGGDGNDMLRGGEGRDTLVGGSAIVGDGVTTLATGNGIDVAVYEKPATSYRVVSIAGGFRVTDVANGQYDDLYNIEYLLFNSATTPSFADTGIGRSQGLPPAGTDLYELPYVYVDFDAAMSRIYRAVDINTDGNAYQSVTWKPGIAPVGHFTDAQKREIIQGVQAIFDRSGIEVTVVAGRTPEGHQGGTSAYFTSQKLFYDNDGNPATAKIQYRGSSSNPEPDYYNRSLSDDVLILMDGYQADGTTPISPGEMQILINTIAHEFGHAFGLAHVGGGDGTNVMDYVSTATERFPNGISLLDVQSGLLDGPLGQNQFYLLNRYVVGVNSDNVTPGGVDLKQVQPSEYDLAGLNTISFTLRMAILAAQFALQLVSTSTADSGDMNSFPLFDLGASTADGTAFNITVTEGQVIRILGSSVPDGPVDLIVAFDTPDGPVTELRVGQTMPTTGTVLKYAAPGATPTTLGTISLAVTSVESFGPPTATDDTITLDEDGTVVISVLTNDSVTDAGQSLTVTAVSDPAKGNATINPNGTITYTPDANANGQDSFTYTVVDANGDFDTATVTVTVTPVNDAPDAVNDTARAPRNGAVTITVRANDTDVDGDTITVTEVGAAAKGSAVVNGNSTVTYTPNPGYVGPDSFTYTISDGKGGTDTATVNVTVADPRVRLIMPTGYAGAVRGAVDVFGTSGFQDLTILDGSYGVALDGSFSRGGDIVRLPGNAIEYEIRLAGSNAELTKGALSVLIPIGTDGLPIVFDDGVRKLVFDGAALKIGAQTFSASAGKITAVADGTPLPTGENPAAVARMLITADSVSALDGNAQVFGSNSGERLTIIDGSAILDGSFSRGGDTIMFNEGASNFAAYIGGSSLILVDTVDDDLITIPIGVAGLSLSFDGDVRVMRYDAAANGIFIGGQKITATTFISAQDLDPAVAPLAAAFAHDAMTFA